MHKTIRNHIESSIEVKRRILASEEIINEVAGAAGLIITAYKHGRKVLLAGNGGSAADAQHIAAELVNRFGFDRPGLAAIALTTDSSVITSVGNDSGYEKIFARQAETLGESGDIFIGISTSGTSGNIVEALRRCREKKMVTIGLTGSKGDKMEELCDICIKVPSDITPRIQEAHILIGHIICSIVENELFGNLNPQK